MREGRGRHDLKWRWEVAKETSRERKERYSLSSEYYHTSTPEEEGTIPKRLTLLQRSPLNSFLTIHNTSHYHLPQPVLVTPTHGAYKAEVQGYYSVTLADAVNDQGEALTRMKKRQRAYYVTGECGNERPQTVDTR